MKKIRIITSVSIILSLVAILAGPSLQVALAAALLNSTDTMSSLKDFTVSNHTIVFRTPTGAADSTDTITIEFDKGAGTAFTIPGALDFTDVDLAHSAGGQANCTAPTFSNDEALAATASATAWGVATSTTDIITLTAPTDGVGVAAIAANACVRVKIGTNATTGVTGDQQITNPDITTATNYVIAIAGAFGDSGDITVPILLDDQVSVSATVNQTLTFTISDSTVGFGTLSSSAAQFATGDTNGTTTEAEAHNLVGGTNAANGYTITVTGTTLQSTPTSITVTAIGATNTSSSPGTEQFGLRMTATGGTGTVSAPYAAAGFALDTAAFPDEVASATAATANTTYSVRYIANISSTTEAGSYTATLTYTATANF